MADTKNDPSTSEKKDPSTSEQIRRAKPSFSKTALPYIMAAVIASTAMAWYFFVFVPGKLDYFVGLKFRTLAVASGHVGAKVQNMAKALRSVPGLAAKECPVATDDRRNLASSYIALVLPEIQLDGPTGARATGLRLTECEIAGTVAWPDVAAQAAAASRRDFDDLILANESVQTEREMRFGGKAAADANGEAMLNVRTANAPRGGEGDIVDFRIAAPGAAAGYGHLELARKIVEVAIAAESAVHGERPGRSVEMFFVSEAGDGASRDGANNVTACPGGGQAGPF